MAARHSPVASMNSGSRRLRHSFFRSNFRTPVIWTTGFTKLPTEVSSLSAAELNRAVVLMQYFGYLRRKPNDPSEATSDYTGYEFWLGKLNQFNGNFVSAEMVKAFITASEYKQRFSQ